MSGPRTEVYKTKVVQNTLMGPTTTLTTNCQNRHPTRNQEHPHGFLGGNGGDLGNGRYWNQGEIKRGSLEHNFIIHHFWSK